MVSSAWQLFLVAASIEGNHWADPKPVVFSSLGKDWKRIAPKGTSDKEGLSVVMVDGSVLKLFDLDEKQKKALFSPDKNDVWSRFEEFAPNPKKKEKSRK